jgi:hypothetical protein
MDQERWPSLKRLAIRSLATVVAMGRRENVDWEKVL